MIAILIFAGRSTRFWPFREKSFFPICGSTLLQIQVERLRSAGFKEIVLVGGTHNVKNAKTLFPNMTFVEQKDLELGMRGALLSALPRCKKSSVFIVSANDMIDGKAYAHLRTKGAKLKEGGLILAKKVTSYFPGGYLSSKGRRITGIVEKPGEGNEPSDLVNIVAHVHADASVLLHALQKTVHAKDDGYELALDALFKEARYEAVSYVRNWQAVKYPWHLLNLLPLLLPAVSKPIIPKSCTVHRMAVIEGSVVLGENVKVMAHASVIGPCFIGDGTIVANNALVRGSSIGRDCVIGYNTEIARSVLGNDVWTHSSYVGDSVLGSDISLGAGTTTGNLRFDESIISSGVRGQAVLTGHTKLGSMIGDHCRTGIHTCISPGVKIGANSCINSNTLVTQDIPDGSFVKDGEVRPNKKLQAPPPDRGAFRSAFSGKRR